MKSFWKSKIHHINVVVEEKNGTISLLTFYPFTSESCGNDTNLQLINQFDQKTLKWRTNNFYLDKFEDLHDCTFVIGVVKHCEPSVIIEQKDKNQMKFSGFEVEIFENIGKILNMNQSFEAFEDGGLINQSDSKSFGSLQSVYERKIDGTLGMMSLQYERSHFLYRTRSFLAVPVVIVIPPPAVISPIQKLILPFTAIVWICFLSTYFSGIIVITIVRKKSRRAYNFLVGTEIQTPILNMFQTFFGGSLSRLPSKNFSRFVLMNFILFCLVIRSMYQAKLFIMLQTDLREKTLNTDDMMEKKMTFYASESLFQTVQEMHFENRFVIDY